MSMIIEIVAYVFIDLFLATTGGFIVWFFKGFKTKFRDEIKPDPSKAYIVGLAFWIFLAVACGLYFHFIK